MRRLRRSEGEAVNQKASLPQVIGPADVTPEEVLADAWAEESIDERLPRIRTVATAWGAAVTAITALFGLGTLAGADAVVTKLKDPWNVLFGLAALGAILCAAFALYFSSRAAQPARIVVPIDIGGRMRLPTQAFEAAVDDLKLSRWFAGVAVILLCICIGVRWYAPQNPTPTNGKVESAAMFMSEH